jgi:predicted kinase
MAQPTLYLFIGAPGAGKTSVAYIISEATGAKHLWADVERHKLFPTPTHSLEESTILYDKLNATADYLLAQGRSVVFDTNFNFYADREKLRVIGDKHNAQTVLVWMDTPIEVARVRALDPNTIRNGYTRSMTAVQFNDIVSKLESPHDHENFIKIDGTKLDPAQVKLILNL